MIWSCYVQYKQARIQEFGRTYSKVLASYGLGVGGMSSAVKILPSFFVHIYWACGLEYYIT